MANAKGKRPNVLFIDIETKPNLAYVWSLWKQNVGISQIKEAGAMFSFASKWGHSKRVDFFSDFHDGHENMVHAVHERLDAADVVVTYNGDRFDIPHLNTEFLKAGLTPPSPFHSVDLLKTMKRRFRFPSNKLDYVTQALGQKGKVRTGGFELWLGCLNNDPKAWALMRRYNKQDVTELEVFYNTVLAWIPNHPHMGLLSGRAAFENVCGRCESTNLVRKGTRTTGVGVYPRLRCKDCGGWSRGKTRLFGADARGIH